LIDIYLDQNHWIYLARACNGRPAKPGHKEVALRLASSLRKEKCRLPLSLTHLIENLKKQDPGPRARLAKVFDEYSAGWYIAPWTDFVPEELKRAVAEVFRTLLIFPSPEIIGRGFVFAVGKYIRHAIPEKWWRFNAAQYAQHSQLPGALFDLLTSVSEENRRKQSASVLQHSSSSAQAAEKMRDLRKAESEAMWKRIHGAEALILHQQHLSNALVTNGKTMDDFIGLGVDGMCNFWTRVATVHVDSELCFYRDRQWTREVQPNDVGDLVHLVGAIPYCDVVVTEKFWCRAAKERKLDKHYGTSIFADLESLLDII
jgi:hypothetical protein